QAFERAGQTDRACAHRVALAEMASDDAQKVAAAVRCEETQRHHSAVERLLMMSDDERVRAEARRLASIPYPTPPIRGELVLDAHWNGNADVDLTLITPHGTRISWMGGRLNVLGQDATSSSHEELALRHATPGAYLLEVSRADESRTTSIRGEVSVR